MSYAALAPLKVIRPYGKKTEKDSQGEPTLLVNVTNNYNWVYNDQGTGSHMDVTIFRPSPTDPSYFILGDYAQGNYAAPYGTSMIVKTVNDNPNYPLLAPPVGYSEVWNDHGTGGDNDGSFWHPTAPDGYVAIGCVCNAGYDPPAIGNLMCVRRDLVETAQQGPLIWNDSGSGGDDDVALYGIAEVPGVFMAQSSYEPLTTPLWSLKGY